MSSEPAPADESQRVCDVFVNHLVGQGYLVAQDLVGDDQRVIFVGRKSGARVVAEIQLGATTVLEAGGARSIAEGLKSMLEKHKATESMVVFAGAAQLDSDARRVIEEAGVKLLRVDPASDGVVTF